MSLFVDSWARLGSFDKRDPDHEVARATVLGAIHERSGLVTSDYVLGETVTLLFRRQRREHFVAAVALCRMFDTIEEAAVQIERISHSRFSKAYCLRFAYSDKPDISFTDLTSMVVMDELGIADIITRDRDFLAVNRGYRLLPELGEGLNPT